MNFNQHSETFNADVMDYICDFIDDNLSKFRTIEILMDYYDSKGFDKIYKNYHLSREVSIHVSEYIKMIKPSPFSYYEMYDNNDVVCYLIQHIIKRVCYNECSLQLIKEWVRKNPPINFKTRQAQGKVRAGTITFIV